jgi:hypothetical protein
VRREISERVGKNEEHGTHDVAMVVVPVLGVVGIVVLGDLEVIPLNGGVADRKKGSAMFAGGEGERRTPTS